VSLRDQLQTIYNDHGKLTPALVVDVARDLDHPLHNRLEWDDLVAAESHRRDQAHDLIRSVRISHVPGEAPIVRAYHAVRDTEDEYVYEPVEKIAADPLMTKMLLADMEREWRTLRRRYEEFDEFWHLVRGDEAAA